MPDTQPADVSVYDAGSIVIVTPLTEAATEWVDENVSEERMSYGAGFVVEHRYAGDLLQGMAEAGLVLEGV